MTMDCGSAVTTCPEDVGEVFGFEAPASGFKDVTADGHASEHGHASGWGAAVSKGRHRQRSRDYLVQVRPS